MRRLTLLVLALLAFAAPAAWAQGSNAPPGNSGVDQYLEAVPSSSGNKPSKDVRSAKSGTVSSTVSKALSSQGKSGTQLKQLIASSSPSSAKAKGNGKRSKASGTPKTATPSAAGSSPVRSAFAAAGGDGGGMGLWLPLVLGAAALAAIALLLLRRRATPPT